MKNERYLSNDYLNEFEENENNIDLIKHTIEKLSLKLSDSINKSKYNTVYCGSAGIIYMNLILYELEKDEKYLNLCLKMLDILKPLNLTFKDTPSFLEGITGIYSLCAVIYYYKNINENKVQNKYIDLLYEYCKQNQSELIANRSECELLYGKCGLIYSLLFCRNIWINTHHKKNFINILYLTMVSIFNYGIKYSQKYKNHFSLSLYYEWHKTIYLGAAHGYAGILFILFKLIIFLFNNFDLLISKNDCDEYFNLYNYYNSKDSIENEIKEQMFNYLTLIYNVTDQILSSYVTDEFNVYSSIKLDKKLKGKEYLIQWCHGNPGFIILIIELINNDIKNIKNINYKNNSSNIENIIDIQNKFIHKYEKYIESMGLLLWQKGLLVKGFGLCHGISGNGLIFLYIYNYTKNKIWYLRALKYALFSIKNYKDFYDVPDRPNSLFEGSAGLVVFLSFLLNIDKTYFPAHDFSKIF